jgi:hypothetical protein
MRESREGIVRVRHIVEDLKDFSRADASRTGAADLPGDRLHPQHRRQRGQYKRRRGPKRRVEIECLPLQINQVVMNLIVNAAHAMGPERGTITLRTGMARPPVGRGGRHRQHRARRAVAHLRSLLHHQAGGQRHRLGLSLAYGIVKNTAAASKSILNWDAAASACCCRSPHGGTTMSRILLVDDEPNMLSALQRALRQSKPLAGRRLKPSPIRSRRSTASACASSIWWCPIS